MLFGLQYEEVLATRRVQHSRGPPPQQSIDYRAMLGMCLTLLKCFLSFPKYMNMDALSFCSCPKASTMMSLCLALQTVQCEGSRVIVTL